MTKITKEQYQAAIPECCRFQTAQEHCDVLFWCWGLISAIERGKPMTCGTCEFADRKLASMGKAGNE